MTITPEISATDLVNDAGWMPYRLDMQRRAVVFGRFDRDSVSTAPFLDYRIEGAAKSWAETSIDELLALAPQPQKAQPSFLFHTSYCCSTLLARALDCPGRVLALKEPEIIMGLSNAYRVAGSQSETDLIHKLRDLILTLVARPYVGDEHVVIKPTNAANNIIPTLAALGAPIILLYGDLKGFLVSVLKKGDPCKTLVRQIYRVYAMDQTGVAAIPQRDALALTDLQIAALVWRHQIELFNAIVSDPARSNVRSLDFRTLLERPAETLEAVNSHMKFGFEADDCRAIAGSALFQRDAKDETRPYDAAKREKEELALIEQNVSAIDMIEDWVFKLSLWPTTTTHLPRPLLD